MSKTAIETLLIKKNTHIKEKEVLSYKDSPTSISGGSYPGNLMVVAGGVRSVSPTDTRVSHRSVTDPSDFGNLLTVS